MLFFTGSAHNSWHILRDQEKSTITGKGSALESMHQIRKAAEQMQDALVNAQGTGGERGAMDEAHA